MTNPICTPVVKALPFSGHNSNFHTTHFQRVFQGNEVEFYFQGGVIPAAFDLQRRVQEHNIRAWDSSQKPGELQQSRHDNLNAIGSYLWRTPVVLLRLG